MGWEDKKLEQQQFIHKPRTGLHPDVGLAICQTDRMYRRALKLFLGNQDKVREIATSLSDQQWVTAAALLHNMISTAGYIGAELLSAQCRAAHTACNENAAGGAVEVKLFDLLTEANLVFTACIRYLQHGEPKLYARAFDNLRLDDPSEMSSTGKAYALDALKALHTYAVVMGNMHLEQSLNTLMKDKYGYDSNVSR